MTLFLRTYQTQIMLVLSGICGIIAVFAFITKYPSRHRKTSQIIMALSAMMLLISEILGEYYFGVTTPTGYWVVRICNFLVYLTTIWVVHSFTLFLMDYVRVDLKQPVPKRLNVVSYLSVVGELLVLISPFTGLYYTFDEQNRYHRSALYPISYVFPLLSILLLFTVIIQLRKKTRIKMWITLMLFPLIPLVAAIIQFFAYGIYITDMAIVGMVVLLYMLTLFDTNHRLAQAQKREVEFLKQERAHTQKLFVETAIALVDAIDAKDAYTHGHSARVAAYAKEIASLSSKSEEECERVYYAALLHDVGKIGIPDHIINKDGVLTPQEYEIIKSHTTIGSQILSEIKDSPYLSVAAKYHHERYDGSGYPEGLAGEEIPELARIISVADAYDAMTSNRSYRKQLSQEEVHDELVRCAGTQFDPEYVRIMLSLIERDKLYTMREA
ncbi:MAG: HD domain-containing protein [Clostridia bacterium]|nr:HD domain-containing protein [Clostridia bacterium]